jgi:hypothetical protein
MANPTGKGGFRTRKHQINKNGRPKSFDALRTLAQEIAHEVAQSKEQDVIINGKKATITEVILRQWAQSKNPKLQQQFIEVTYGKVPTPVEHTGKDGNAITIRVEYANADTDAT